MFLSGLAAPDERGVADAARGIELDQICDFAEVFESQRLSACSVNGVALASADEGGVIPFAWLVDPTSRGMAVVKVARIRNDVGDTAALKLRRFDALAVALAQALSVPCALERDARLEVLRWEMLSQGIHPRIERRSRVYRLFDLRAGLRAPDADRSRTGLGVARGARARVGVAIAHLASDDLILVLEAFRQRASLQGADARS